MSLDFDQVYARHARFVFRVLRGMGVPDGSIDDATQDVFVVVHQRLASFDRRAQVTSWLFQIALRVALTHRRKGKRVHDAIDDDALPNSGRSPLEVAETAQQLAELQTLLDELDDDKRALLVLAELEQLTAPEIAELTKVPLNTVYTRLRRARAAFASLWQNKRAGAKP